jgi:hypothetical protein
MIEFELNPSGMSPRELGRMAALVDYPVSELEARRLSQQGSIERAQALLWAERESLAQLDAALDRLKFMSAQLARVMVENAKRMDNQKIS